MSRIEYGITLQSESREGKVQELNARRPFEEPLARSPSVSLDMKVASALRRAELVPSGSEAIVRQTKDAVSEHPPPSVCMHDHHFGIRPSDLTLRLRSA